jgi:hypothetical protein
MGPRVQLHVAPQPDLVSCGPTCLHSLYRYWGDDVGFDAVLGEVERLEHGGTLAALLACHALARGYRALLYTYDLTLFDPTWFKPTSEPTGLGARSGGPSLVAVASPHAEAGRGSAPAAAHPAWSGGPEPVDLVRKLRAQLRIKRSRSLVARGRAYLQFLDLGGRIALAEPTPRLFASWLERGVPVLAGLSATYLYQSARERVHPHDPSLLVEDDLRGEPTGHFVVLRGYDPDRGEVSVADPLQPNPVAASGLYRVNAERLQAAILLGVLTGDANLLVLEPPRGPRPLDLAGAPAATP